MGSLLVHITVGPENPTRAALGFLVAKQALEMGHTVTVFLAAEAVHLIKTPVIDSVVGLGSGSLRAHYDAIVAGGGRFVVSGLSAKIRGVVDEDYVGKPAEVGMPNTLVDLIFSHDRTVVY